MKTLIQIQEDQLILQDAFDFCKGEDLGAIEIFVGTVRNHNKQQKVLKLEFSAYLPMALKEMKKIAEEAIREFNVKKIAMLHRVGSLEIGDLPVIIACSSAHRKQAQQACAFCIDTLKERVPIWKKEYFEGGEVWINAHP